MVLLRHIIHQDSSTELCCRQDLPLLVTANMNMQHDYDDLNSPYRVC